MNRKSRLWIGLWLLLVIVTGVLAIGYGPSGVMGYGPWHGWGHMGGWDEDQPFRGEGAHAWQGMGPGMTDGAGFGHGWATHNPYGMTGAFSNMMGGGAGMPYAMMPGWLPDLTPDQIAKIGKLLMESAERNRSVIQQSWEAQARLNSLNAAERRDWNAIRTASHKVFELQRQQLDAAIDMQQKTDALLTDSQRQAMARVGRGQGWMGGQ